MSTFPTHDPEKFGGEGLSQPILGVSHAVTSLGTILNMENESVEDIEMREVISDVDTERRIYSTPVPYKSWLAYPEPIIKKNGVVITPLDGFTIDLLGGSIDFYEEENRPEPEDVFTASFTYVTGKSEVIDDLTETTQENKDKLDKNRGTFHSVEDLKLQIEDPQDGDYAFIFGDVMKIYFYDVVTKEWLPTSTNFVLREIICGDWDSTCNCEDSGILASMGISSVDCGVW